MATSVDPAKSRGDDQTAHRPEGSSWTVVDPLPDFDLVDDPDSAGIRGRWADGTDRGRPRAPATGMDRRASGQRARTRRGRQPEAVMIRRCGRASSTTSSSLAGPVPVPDSGFSAEFIAELTSDEGTPAEADATPTDREATDGKHRLRRPRTQAASVAPSDELRLEDALGEEPSSGGSGDEGTGRAGGNRGSVPRAGSRGWSDPRGSGEASRDRGVARGVRLRGADRPGHRRTGRAHRRRRRRRHAAAGSGSQESCPARRGGQ